MQDDFKSLNQKSEDKTNKESLSSIADSLVAGDATITKKQRLPHRLKAWFSGLSGKQKALVVIGLLVALSLVGYGIWYFFFKPAPVTPPPPPAEQAVAEPAKTTEVSRLTGIEYPIADKINDRTVTAVMVENSPDARPQSGLNEAGVVYEAVAEGGITRFVTLFQDTSPEIIGPVRSVRPYYLDFIGPYNAAIAHVGGSGQALAEIKAQNIKDLDQFSNPGPYWRERTRYAPHNMYTNMKKLKEVEKEKGWNPTEYTGLVRGADSTPSATPNASKINITMSSTNYNVEFNYDKATNTYLRSVGGRPHVDAQSNKQLAPKIVVVPVINRTQSGIYSVYAVNGSGKVFVFQNGTVTEGTWSKSGRNNQFTFTGADGQPLKLASGQTWITVAATPANVAVTP